ncbi:MAG TPA: DUF2530 domain-containing protein [Mycobacteriales bacterium]|nr:DUF2530 domain-containing protein [Mycobacteriales bacterium]
MTAAPDRTTPEPLDVDAVWPVAAGTALWFLGFLVLLPFRQRLIDHGHELWLWTCLAGGGLGLIGLPMCLRQRTLTRQSRALPPSPTTAPPPPGDEFTHPVTDPPSG